MPFELHPVNIIYWLCLTDIPDPYPARRWRAWVFDFWSNVLVGRGHTLSWNLVFAERFDFHSAEEWNTVLDSLFVVLILSISTLGFGDYGAFLSYLWQNMFWISPCLEEGEFPLSTLIKVIRVQYGTRHSPRFVLRRSSNHVVSEVYQQNSCPNLDKWFFIAG